MTYSNKNKGQEKTKEQNNTDIKTLYKKEQDTKAHKTK